MVEDMILNMVSSLWPSHKFQETIVKNNGSITLTSEFGKGTTFTIFTPNQFIQKS